MSLKYVKLFYLYLKLYLLNFLLGFKLIKNLECVNNVVDEILEYDSGVVLALRFKLLYCHYVEMDVEKALFYTKQFLNIKNNDYGMLVCKASF